MGTSRFLNFLIRLEVETFTWNQLTKNVLVKSLKSRMNEGKEIWKRGSKASPQDISKTMGYIGLHK